MRLFRVGQFIIGGGGVYYGVIGVVDLLWGGGYYGVILLLLSYK